MIDDAGIIMQILTTQVFRLSGNVISLIRSFLVGFNCTGHVLVFTTCLVTKLVFEERLSWHDGLQMGYRWGGVILCRVHTRRTVQPSQEYLHLHDKLSLRIKVKISWIPRIASESLCDT